LKKLALILPVLVVIAAFVFFAVHRRTTVRHANAEVREAAVTRFNFAQQLSLAQAACGSAPINVDKKKQILCSVCPAGSDFAGTGGMPGSGTGWTLDGAVPGSFSAKDADEALLHATGCESHAKSYGGNFLMRRTGGQWSAVRYASGGTANDKCQKVQLDSGRDTLVCQVTDMHAGIVSDSVQLLQFDAEQPPADAFAYAEFLGVIDEAANCGFDSGSRTKPHMVQLAKIEKFEVLPAGTDGRQDVALDVVISRVNSPKAGASCPAGDPHRHHLVFNNAGDHFDAGEGYVALHAMKREDCCEMTVTPRVVAGRY
jgi:hypothetical protein